MDAKWLEEIKNRLLEEEGDISHELKHLKEENPLLSPERTVARIPELEEESSQLEEANKTVDNIKMLEKRLKDTQDALEKIEKGTYGKCEVCGQDIDPARLGANPQARFDLEHEEALPAPEGEE